jgi:hypothetical protein
MVRLPEIPAGHLCHFDVVRSKSLINGTNALHLRAIERHLLRSTLGLYLMRDILVMEIPNVLRTELYAVAALIGAAVMVLGKKLHLPTSVAATTGAVLCFGLRFIAMRRGWQLPIARPPQKSG